jgi:hypothetical protein
VSTPVADEIEIASYRAVFDLERRIYRVDRLRLNPGGIPLRGVLYFVAAALGAAVLRDAPLIGWLIGQLPWYLRYAAIPGLLAAVGASVRVAGRPFHHALRGLIVQFLRPRQLSGFRGCAAIGTRWRPPPIVVIPDGSGRRIRRYRFRGPGVVVVRCAHECVEWRPGWAGRVMRLPDLTVRAVDHGLEAGRGRAIALGRGARVAVEPHAGGPPRTARPRRTG